MTVPLPWMRPSRSRSRRSGPRRGGPPARWATTRVGAYEIHSLEVGEGEEELVLLHGLSGSSRWWERNLPTLARRYRVVVPDLIGFGRTRYRGRLPSIATLAGVLAEWMREAGLGRVHLAGHSMGGQIAVHLAARFPDALHRLVLVDAAGIPRPLTARYLVRFAADIAPLWRWGDPTFLPVIVGDALTAGAWTLLQAIGHIVQDDVRPLLHRIRAPTLVVWGERDNWVPLEHAHILRRCIPDSRLVILPEAAHNPMVDSPAAFNRLLLRFLAGESVGE